MHIATLMAFQDELQKIAGLPRSLTGQGAISAASQYATARIAAKKIGSEGAKFVASGNGLGAQQAMKQGARMKNIARDGLPHTLVPAR